ncbi:hypothetical protein [Paenibacillus sp. NPDC057934]|uniref:hypothetical protein n=1 Tax=Paenibacillus sp. NPDC057934 TaxID=3346282 RepID=UPI0036D7A907
MGVCHKQELNCSNNLLTQPDHTVEWTGTLSYETSLTCYTATLSYQGIELPVQANISTKADMERLSPNVKLALEQFGELGNKELNLIAEANPDEDVNELVLSWLEFEKDSPFLLGYDAGDIPAGQLCIYVVFSENIDTNNAC